MQSQSRIGLRARRDSFLSVIETAMVTSALLSWRVRAVTLSQSGCDQRFQESPSARRMPRFARATTQVISRDRFVLCAKAGIRCTDPEHESGHMSGFQALDRDCTKLIAAPVFEPCEPNRRRRNESSCTALTLPDRSALPAPHADLSPWPCLRCSRPHQSRRA